MSTEGQASPYRYPPRPGDLPREELMEMAQTVLSAYEPGTAEVHFTYTCEACGERCWLDEPNNLRERGECSRCEHETEIRVGGFSLILGGVRALREALGKAET